MIDDHRNPHHLLQENHYLQTSQQDRLLKLNLWQSVYFLQTHLQNLLNKWVCLILLILLITKNLISKINHLLSRSILFLHPIHPTKNSKIHLLHQILQILLHSLYLVLIFYCHKFINFSVNMLNQSHPYLRKPRQNHYKEHYKYLFQVLFHLSIRNHLSQ